MRLPTEADVKRLKTMGEELKAISEKLFAFQDELAKAFKARNLTPEMIDALEGDTLPGAEYLRIAGLVSESIKEARTAVGLDA